MNFKGLLQVMARPWLIEESQAAHWASIAHSLLIEKSMDATPGKDPRTFKSQYEAHRGQFYDAIFRVDANGNIDPAGPVQVIKLEGPLMEGDYCGAPGMQTMQQAIRAANADDTIQSIVLYNDSPGGTVSGTENLANEVKNSKKPVVSFVNKMMCSANYWVGSSAREIIADDETGGLNSMIGSIGTKCMIMDDTEFQKNRGIKIISIAADKSKRKGKWSEDVLAGDYTRLKSELNQINDRFIAGIQETRAGKLRLDKDDVFEGDVYDAKQAMKLGLIDKMGSFSYAVKRSLQMAKTIKA